MKISDQNADFVCNASISGTCSLLTQGWWSEGSDGPPCMEGCELKADGTAVQSINLCRLCRAGFHLDCQAAGYFCECRCVSDHLGRSSEGSEA